MKKTRLLRFAIGLLCCVFVFGCVYFRTDPFHMIGGAFCHQFESRTPFAGERSYPFCYRCTGLFFGIFVSLLYFRLSGSRMSSFSRFALVFTACAAVFFVIDILNATTLWEIEIYPDQTVTRMLSGYSMGFALVLIIQPMRDLLLDEEPEEAGTISGKNALPMFVFGGVFLTFQVYKTGFAGYFLIGSLTVFSAVYFLYCLYEMIVTILHRENIREWSFLLTLLHLTAAGILHLIIIEKTLQMILP